MKMIKKIIQIGDSEGVTFGVKEKKALKLQKGDFVRINVEKIEK